MKKKNLMHELGRSKGRRGKPGHETTRGMLEGAGFIAQHLENA
jgi:hypothetical protein